MPIYPGQAARGGHASQFIHNMQTFEVSQGTMISNGLVADSYGNTRVYGGTIIAKITGSHLSSYGQLVVRTVAPSYGPGSDAAVGVLLNDVDLSLGPKNVAYIVRGTLREAHCKDVGTYGTVTAATKARLPHVIWV